MTGASLPDTHRKYFDRFDVDENGKVCRDEFKQGVKSMGLGLNDEELDRLATIVWANGLEILRRGLIAALTPTGDR